jgi:hypothetical protein
MSSVFESLVADAVSDARNSLGWDFNYLKGRRHCEQPPWSYDEKILSFLDDIESLCDMDTGGGEILRSLHKRATKWPKLVSATEGFLPNVAIAKKNLEPIGIEVLYYKNYEKLPLSSHSQDLIINRHGTYSVIELGRLLKAGGLFITQQVGSDMCIRLNRILQAPDKMDKRWDLVHALEELQTQGFDIIESQEYHGQDVFDDIGAVVWYLTKVLWQIPDFSIEAYQDRLFALYSEIKANGPIDVGNHHFFIVARRP